MRSSFARWLLLGIGGCAVAIAIAFVWDKYQANGPDIAAPAAANFVPPAPAAPGIGRSEPEDLFAVFASAPPIQPAQYETKELQKIFPEFQHRPFESAGFDEVMLPFAYSDPDHLGDANEALALDALMSNDLDWSPRCYCARHAYFVFKRDRDRMLALQRGYTRELISPVIEGWKATHAIGGELIRTAAGYKAKLQIFGPDGKEVFVRSYDQPRTIWDLLGDMDVDAMTFLDVKPSEELAAFLHEPRCKQPESIADLGSAAFTAERTPEEFGVYEKILKADPGFAMVRHWYANQKHWVDRDDTTLWAQNGKALSTRVEPAALSEFSQARCPDQVLAAQYPAWLDNAAALVSEDSPFVIDCRLRNACYGSQTRDAIVERGLKTAAKYPNSHDFVEELGLTTNNAWMSASLLTSSLLDRFLPGDGSKEEEQRYLAYYCGRVGRQDIAMLLLSELGPRQSQEDLYQLLESLTDSGRYAEAAQMYQLLGRQFDPSLSKWMAPNAAFSAVVSGKPKLLDQILNDQHDVLAAENLDDVFQAYRDAMDGKTIDAQKYVLLHRALSFSIIWNMLLVAYSDAKAGTSQYHRLMTECTYQWPMDRLILIAQDDYQRRDPSNDAGAFYDYLGWLFGDDPWAAKAVADFRKRGGIDKPIDPTVLRADLQQGLTDGPYRTELGNLDWNHVLTCWRVAACVHQLLKQNNTRDAADIAGMYKDYELLTPREDGLIVAFELTQKVADWKNAN